MIITIVVPVYNVENELERCVNSLLSQTVDDIEILLIDDGSKDQSGTICDNLSEKDKRIHVYHKKNGGLSDARNYGLLRSKGEYVLFVDSDDYIDLNTCEKFIHAIEHCRADVIVGEAIKYENNQLYNMIHTNLVEGKVYTAKQYILDSIKVNEFFAPSWLNIYRKDFLLENCLFFAKGFFHEDMEILPKIFLSAKKISYMSGPFYHYVIRTNSIMTSKNPKKYNDSIEILQKWDGIFSVIDDKELRKALKGYLVKCYLRICRNEKRCEKEFGFKYLMRNALNMKERAKVMYFTLLTNQYINGD